MPAARTAQIEPVHGGFETGSNHFKQRAIGFSVSGEKWQSETRTPTAALPALALEPQLLCR